MLFESELPSSIGPSCSVTYIFGSSNIAKHLLPCARWPAEPLSASPDGAGAEILPLRGAPSRSCVLLLIILLQFVRVLRLRAKSIKLGRK